MHYFATPGLKFYETRILKPKSIVDTVSKVTCVSLQDLENDSKKRRLVIARHLCFFYLRKYTDKSLSEIGTLFNRDHTTVMHGIKTVGDLVYIKDKELAATMFKIEEFFIELTHPLFKEIIK